MEMPAFNQILLPHVILLVPDIITAIAIIKTAVAVITKVVVEAIVVHTTPGEAVLMTDAAEATPDGDPVHMIHHNPGHLDNTTASHDLTKDVDPTYVAVAGPHHQEEDMAIIPIQSLQITNVPGMLLDLSGRKDTELIKVVYCSHKLSKLSHETSY